MPDSRFYRRAGPFRLGDLAGWCGGALVPGTDANTLLHDVSGLDGAGAQDITYFSDPRYTVAFGSSRSGACITTQAFAKHAPQKCAIVVVGDPRAAFAEITARFYPEPANAFARDAIAPDAMIEPDVVIAPGVVIGPGAKIGRGTRLDANVVIGPGVIIGSGCRISANATLMYCIVGERVLVHPGVCIGQDGFGFVMSASGHIKVPQLGRVLIGDDVEIGANCTVDRGAMSDTVIGSGTKIDNLVQVAHNVQIGERCIIVAQAGMAGSARIGNGVVIGGQVAIVSHVQVGDGAQIAGQSGVIRDIAPGEVVMGYPAKPIRQFWRDVAALSRLTKRDKTP